MCKFCFFASKTWFSCNTCTQSHLKKQKHLRRFFSQLHLLLPVLLVFINRYEPCPCIYLKVLIKRLIQISVIFSIPYLFLFLDGLSIVFRITSLSFIWKKLFFWKFNLCSEVCAAPILVMGPVMGLFLLRNEVFLMITVK